MVNTEMTRMIEVMCMMSEQPTRAFATTLTRTSPFFGGATSTSSILRGCLAAQATAALHLYSDKHQCHPFSTDEMRERSSMG